MPEPPGDQDGGNVGLGAHLLAKDQERPRINAAVFPHIEAGADPEPGRVKLQGLGQAFRIGQRRTDREPQAPAGVRKCAAPAGRPERTLSQGGQEFGPIAGHGGQAAYLQVAFGL